MQPVRSSEINTVITTKHMQLCTLQSKALIDSSQLQMFILIVFNDDDDDNEY